MIALTNEQRTNVLKWVEALESGKYNQIIGVLKNKNGYCCLGVACEVLDIPSKLYDNNINVYVFNYEDGQYLKYLPTIVSKMLGFNKGDAIGIFPEPITMPNGKTYSSLAGLNDEGCYDFKTIAKIIRQVWLGEK